MSDQPHCNSQDHISRQGFDQADQPYHNIKSTSLHPKFPLSYNIPVSAGHSKALYRFRSVKATFCDPHVP